MTRRGARPALRLLWLLGGLAFALVAIGGRLVQLQVLRASAFEDLGAKQRIRKIELPARRGGIYDRNGVPLALSVEARAIYANPQLVDDPGATAAAVAKVLGVDPKPLKERLTRKKLGFVYLARKIEISTARKVLDLDLPGIGTLDETKRIYPQGTLAGQVIGFVGLDDHGLGGLESGFDKVLAGTPGEEIVEQDPRGRPIAHGVRSLKRPVRGLDIVLTLDRDVQFQAERALEDAVRKTGAKDGIAVVLDARTNEVLAMANYPPFDPAKFASADPDARRNRAVQDAYEPGSVNKLVTAAAALDNGVVRPGDMLTIPYTIRVANDTFRDFQGHETWRINYNEALARSSNVGTIQVALKLGARRMYEMLEKFGLGHKTGVEFPGESPGISLPLKKWSGTSIATIPIGQGIAVTPLQMMNVYTTVARDGVWMTPRLVKKVGDETPSPKHQPRRVVSTFTASQLRGMLLNVVENGTGRSARIPGYLIGGKTGTANKPDRGGYSSDVITTFIGMVPVDTPRFVVGVALDSPEIHMAAATAAPAFQRITSFVLARWGVPPQVIPTGKDASKPLQPARSPVAPKPKPTAVPSSSPASTPKPKPTASASPKPKPTTTPARARSSPW